MAKMASDKIGGTSSASPRSKTMPGTRGTRPSETKRPATLPETCVFYCGDNPEPLAKPPDACVDLTYTDPPFNSNRNYDGGQSGSDFWGETKEKRAFEDRHANTKACIDYLSRAVKPACSKCWSPVSAWAMPSSRITTKETQSVNGQSLSGRAA